MYIKVYNVYMYIMLVNHQLTAVNHNENKKKSGFVFPILSLFLSHSLRHIATAIILWRYRWSRVNSFQVKYLCIIIYISFYSFIGVHIILYIFFTYLYNSILYYYTVGTIILQGREYIYLLNNATLYLPPRRLTCL